jgi:hypothetical protein
MMLTSSTLFDPSFYIVAVFAHSETSDNCSRRGHHLPAATDRGEQLRFLEDPGWFSGAAVLNLIMGVVLGYFGYMA